MFSHSQEKKIILYFYWQEIIEMYRILLRIFQN